MRAFGKPLFYDSEIMVADLKNVIIGAVEPPTVDIITFAAEHGGDQERQLALPYLPGMDEVAVTAAELAFRVGNMTLDVSDYSTPNGPGGLGVVLRFAAPVRLRKVEVQHGTPTPEKTKMRLVVRPMQDNAPGPPILATPDFKPAGDMFGRMLTGLGASDLGGGRTMLTFPDLLGTAWLLQLAIVPEDQDEVTKLAPMPVVPKINSVAVAAAPRNLALTLAGSPPTPLWGNADILLPGSGEQNVSFLPIAQRRLSDALAASDTTALTLPLALHFHSDTGATLEVSRLALAGEYRAAPLGTDPVTLRLAARPVPLLLDAPAMLRPSGGKVMLTARLLGRTLNGGSRPAQLVAAGRGLRATAQRMVAARVPIAARSGDPAGTPVPLASVALRIGTPEAAEIALELRGDVNGRPGAVLAPPIVRQFDAGFADWCEFELPAPLPLAPASALWVAVRLTKGSALWHGAASGPGEAGACVSADRGGSWGDAADALGFAAPLLVQAFHAEPPPFARPEIFFHDGVAPLPGDWLAGAVADTETQFRLADAALPKAVLDRLATTPPRAGSPRGDTRILLYSAAVLDLVLTGMTLSYDPFG